MYTAHTCSIVRDACPNVMVYRVALISGFIDVDMLINIILSPQAITPTARNSLSGHGKDSSLLGSRSYRKNGDDKVWREKHL